MNWRILGFVFDVTNRLFVLIFSIILWKTFVFEAHLHNITDVAADCLEQFALILIKQKYKSKQDFVKNDFLNHEFLVV